MDIYCVYLSVGTWFTSVVNFMVNIFIMTFQRFLFV